MTTRHHPHFSLPWCQRLLTSPDTTNITIPPRTTHSIPPNTEPPTPLFLTTLYTPHGILAQTNFHRPSLSPSSITPTEHCILLSLSTGLDGKRGRLHGGVNAMILDQILGSVAASALKSEAPATATMTVDYLLPIGTPGVVLVRGWAVEISGRKVWAEAVIEDGEGRVLAKARGLFVGARVGKV